MTDQKIKLIRLSELPDQVSKVHVDDKFITIIDGDYPIEKTRCDTYEKILSWILHLSEKAWVDNETIYDFTEAAMRHANIKRVFM